MNSMLTSTTKKTILKTFIKRYIITLCCLYLFTNIFKEYITILPINMVITSFIYVCVHSIIIVLVLSLTVGNYTHSRIVIYLTFHTMLIVILALPTVTNYVLNKLTIINADIMTQLIITISIILTAITSLGTNLEKSE